MNEQGHTGTDRDRKVGLRVNKGYRQTRNNQSKYHVLGFYTASKSRFSTIFANLDTDY